MVQLRVNNNFLNSLSKKKIICVKKFNFCINIFQHFNIFVNIPNIQHLSTCCKICQHLSTFLIFLTNFAYFEIHFFVNFQQLSTFKEISIRNWYNLDFLIKFKINFYTFNYGIQYSTGNRPCKSNYYNFLILSKW